MAKMVRRPRVIESDIEATPEEQLGFWESLAALDEKGWEHHSLYVYRVAPRIDTGGKAYIAKYSMPVDEAQLLSEHGSGRYLLMLNDTSARSTVSKLTFTAHNDAHPPKVRLDQVVDCPENGKWLAWLRENEQSQRRGTDSTSGEGANTAVENIARMALEGKQSLDPQILDLWTKTAAERDHLAQRLAEASASAPNPLQMVRELMTTAKDLAPQPIPQRSDLEVLDKVLSITSKLNPQQPPVNPLEQLSQFAGIFTQLKETFGTHVDAGPPAPSGPGLGVQILGALAPAFVPLAQALAARILKGDPAPIAQPPSQAENTQLPAAPAGAAPEATPPEANPVMQLADQVVPMLVNALNVGATGEQFASSIATLYGAMAYQTIAVIGKDQILALLRAHPMWGQLSPLETKLGEFVDEFLSFGNNDDEDEAASAA